MKRLITCAQCGKLFNPTSPNQQYCSQVCRDNANSTTCLHCGKLFVAHDSLTLFCSRACYDQFRRKKNFKAQAKGKSLSEWQREAQECNLDYGSYRGLIAQGKTFEELKAQADCHGQRVHNHTPRRKKLAD